MAKKKGSKALETLRDAYGDFSGNTLSDMKTIANVLADAGQGGKGILTTIIKDAAASDSDERSPRAQALHGRSARRRQGAPYRNEHAIRHRSGPSSTGALPTGKVTIEEVVKDKAKGGMVKKAGGGPITKANRKNHRGCGVVMENRRKKTLYT